MHALNCKAACNAMIFAGRRRSFLYFLCPSAGKPEAYRYVLRQSREPFKLFDESSR